MEWQSVQKTSGNLLSAVVCGQVYTAAPGSSGNGGARRAGVCWKLDFAHFILLGDCPGFSWDMVNFQKKLVGLAQTSQSKGIFYTMWCQAQYLSGELAEGRGFCYLGASSVSGGENTACCICFLLALLIVVFFSLCHSAKLFSSQPMSFCLFPSDSPPRPTKEGGGGRG